MARHNESVNLRWSFSICVPPRSLQIIWSIILGNDFSFYAVVTKKGLEGVTTQGIIADIRYETAHFFAISVKSRKSDIVLLSLNWLFKAYMTVVTYVSLHICRNQSF